MLKVLARLNCSRQHLSLLMGEDRGGNQDATAGVSVEELRDGRDRMEQAADGSSSTATVMAGLQMVAFDGSDVVLFKKRVGRGASDRAQPAKNERRRRCDGSSPGKWRRRFQRTDVAGRGVELRRSSASAAPAKVDSDCRLAHSSTRMASSSGPAKRWRWLAPAPTA
jgi:hypothetical protein